MDYIEDIWEIKVGSPDLFDSYENNRDGVVIVFKPETTKVQREEIIARIKESI